ncbi:MAG: Ig-like domain-containing protein [Verrucomicrobiales bacterium]
MRADRANDDAMADFLTNDDPDPDNTPDTLWLSDGAVAPVNLARNGTADHQVSVGNLQVRVTGTFTSGWNYLKLQDPGAGFRLYRLVRADGKELRVGDNAWQTDRSFPSSQAGVRRENLLHILDHDSSGVYTAYYRVDDSVAPTVTEFIAIDPVAQTEPVASVDLAFSEEIDLASFDYLDVVVSLNGGPNRVTSGVTISKVAGSTYRISGLTSLTGDTGNYEVTVIGSGIQDYGANPATGTASVRWTKVDGINPAIVSLQQVVPSLRNAPVPSIDVVFSKPINPATFDFNDLSLVRNGNENLTSSAIVPTQQNATTFRITGLGNLTTDSGEYILTVDASGIEDTSGNAGNGVLTTRWTQDTAPVRLIAIESINTNPRNIVVPSLEVTLSEPIQENTFDFSDVLLSRNGGANLITSTVKVTKVSPTVYRIENFSFVSGNEGTYTLTVNAGGLRDLAGNNGDGSVSVNWTMDITKPAVPTLFAIAPDLGASATDGITSTNKVTFTGTLGETNLTVRLVNLTTGEDLGSLVTGTTKTFTKPLELAQGAHRIQAKATDPAGNVSAEGIFEIFVDLSGVTATLAEVSPDPRDAAVTALDVTFSEPIWEQTFTRDDLKLIRDGGTNLIGNGVSIQFVSARTYRIAGLEAITAAGGLYQLSLNLTNIQDVAGNAGAETLVETWRRTGPNTAPVLEAIGSKIVASESTLMFTNIATDVDIPANKLTFSLEPGAPAGASINATNGVFLWKPTRAQSPGSYQIIVKVTDNGIPALSDTETFTVTVTDYAELNIGEGIVLTGARGAVPVELFASTAVSNLTFVVNLKTNHLTNFTVEALAPEVGSATITKVAEGSYRIDVKARSGSLLQSRQEIVEIAFEALTRPSAFVKFTATDLTVTKPDRSVIPSLFTRDGRAVVLGAEPLVDGMGGPDRKLTLFGKPGLTYQLQSTDRLSPGRIWKNETRTTLSGFSEILDLPDSPGAVIFYQAIRLP